MPDRIKVLPSSEDAVGMVHPVDGPLAKEGSLWTHDDFTQRRLHLEQVVRLEEKAPAAETPNKPAKAAKGVDA